MFKSLISLMLISTIYLQSCASRPPVDNPRNPAAEGRIPSDRGFLTTVEGVMGGLGRCQAPSAKELASVDQKIHRLKVDGSVLDVAKFGKRTVENYLEDFFFQEIAFRSHSTTICQLKFLNSYFDSSAISSPLNENGWKIYSQYHKVLNQMLVLRNEKKSVQNSIRAGHDPMDRSSAQAQNDLKGARLGEEVAGLDQGINSIIAQIAFGQHKNVREALRNLSIQDQVNESEFISVYSDGLQDLRPKLEKAERYFDKKKDKDGFYEISRGDKIAFVQSGRADHLLKEIDPEGNKLACRIKAQYSSGPVTTQLLVMLGLLAASVATDGAAAVLVGLGMTASMIADVQHQCFRPTMNISSTEVNSCDVNKIAASSIEEASMISCGVSVAFMTLPVLMSFAKQVKLSANSLKAAQRSSSELVVAKEAAEAEIVVTARALKAVDEPIIPINISSKVRTEVESCLTQMPKAVTTKLRAKFKNQSEKQTVKDLQDIQDLRRINGNCR